MRISTTESQSSLLALKYENKKEEEIFANFPSASNLNIISATDSN